MGMSRREASSSAFPYCWRKRPRSSTPLSRISAWIVGGLAPARRPFLVLAGLGQVAAPVHGHPAEDLRTREVLRVAAYLPDALVRVAGVLDGLVDQIGDALPRLIDDLGGPLANIGVDGVKDHAPYVVLVLVPGAIPNPHGPRVSIAGEVVEGVFGEVLLAPDAVHDLQGPIRLGGTADGLQDKGEVFDRLPFKAQAVQGAQHERGVPDPGVPVVPVAGPARCFGQRGGGCRHDGARRGVAQPLEGQGTALHVAPPRMIRKIAGGQPVPPVVNGVVVLGPGLVHRVGTRSPPRKGPQRRCRPDSGWCARSNEPRSCPAARWSSPTAPDRPPGDAHSENRSCRRHTPRPRWRRRTRSWARC